MIIEDIAADRWYFAGFAGDFTEDQIQAIKDCLDGHIMNLEDDMQVMKLGHLMTSLD